MLVVIAGGTGFIGNALLEQFVKGKHQVILLSRDAGSLKHLEKDTVSAEQWDAKTIDTWAKRLDGADAVVNLTGEPIAAKRWTPSQKERILKSRVDATKAIVSAIEKVKNKPAVLINASAVGYYGNVEKGDVTESHPKGSDFLAGVCEKWEQEALAAEKHGVRVVVLRIGIVLAKNGGALSKMIPPFKMFAGGPLGSGKQWFPWVHRDDVAGAILFAIKNEKVAGPINVTAPEPVTMKEFCKTLGKVIRKPSWAPVPAFALKILLGEMSDMLLTGQRAIPKKLQEAGYTFKYPKLEKALMAALGK